MKEKVERDLHAKGRYRYDDAECTDRRIWIILFLAFPPLIINPLLVLRVASVLSDLCSSFLYSLGT